MSDLYPIDSQPRHDPWAGYSDAELDEMFDAEVNRWHEEYAATHHVEHAMGELPCDGILNVTPDGVVFCSECGTALKRYAPQTFDMGDAA